MIYQILISTLILFLSVFSFSQELNNELLGEFDYLDGFAKNYNYLTCSQNSSLIVTGSDQELILNGITLSPIQFENINEAPIGISGPLIGYSQRKTTMTSESDSQIRIESLHRNCESLLGKLGCIGKKWRTTSWIEYTKENEKLIHVQVGYQPFESSIVETCEFIKKNL